LSFFRKSLFWVIALVVLGGAFFITDDRVEEAERVEAFNLRLLPFEGADVTALWIGRPGEDRPTRLLRQADGWWLVEPLRARGDDKAIGDLLRNITGTRKDAVLFEQPTQAKLGELGLRPPALELGLITGEGRAVLRFGGAGPTHNVAYAMFEDDPRVYRIHADVMTQVDVELRALRDKTVLAINPTGLRRMELARRGKDKVVITHDRGRWDMRQPTAARAAMAAVLETLYLVNEAEVKAFIDEAPTDLGRYGLDAPRITLSIEEKERDGRQTLSIGAKDRKRRGYFARRDGAANIILLEEAVVNALLADADKWREPDDGA
jgi:hypothetical protein